ncbi:hypothetical protein Tco_1546552 [Tanacetum coccineum]
MTSTLYSGNWYVVLTGRVVVPAGRYVVHVGKVIIIVSPGRLSLVPTGRVLSPGSKDLSRVGSNNMTQDLKIRNLSCSKHRQLRKMNVKMFTGVRIRDTLGVSVSKKKAPAKAERSKGIELLFDAALLEESQLKKALKSEQIKIQIIIKQNNDNEEETTIYDEYAHTPEDYVTVLLTDVEPDAKDKGHKEMTNAETVEAKHENVNQEGVGNQVRDDAQATQKMEVPIPSSLILI